jgi:hypothetical protein
VQFYYLSRKLDNIARYAPIWQHWLKHKNTHATSHFSLTMTLSCQVKAINIYFHHWFTQLKEFASHEILYFVIIIEKTIDSKESNDVINSIKCTPDHFRILKMRLQKLCMWKLPGHPTYMGGLEDLMPCIQVEV